MKIGTILLETPVALAPMAGVTDLAFRTVCRELGAGYTVTEMVSAKALCYGDNKTRSLLQLGAEEHPSAVQIFGSDPQCMAQGAQLALEASGADILDINMGCPTPKIVRSGDGSALMRDLKLAGQVAQAVCRAVSVPVTVKLRLGWDRGSLNAVELSKILEQAGVQALCVHGRTRAQMYSGTADWDRVGEVCRAVNIPVFVNGDIVSPEAALRALRHSGAQGVALGRGTFGNPWLCGQVAAALRGEEIPPLPPLSVRADTAVHQFTLACRYKGEHVAMLEARKHYAWYLKGVPHAGYYKEKISSLSTLEELEKITAGIKRDLRDERR